MQEISGLAVRHPRTKRSCRAVWFTTLCRTMAMFDPLLEAWVEMSAIDPNSRLGEDGVAVERS